MTTVIFKASEACNSNCAYCDVVKKDRAVMHMSLGVLEQFYFRANEYLSRFPDKNLRILWHGGEPLILGSEFFKTALELHHKNCPETGNRLSYDIQTNLTLFSKEFVDVFKEMGITSIGTSYEPIPGLRGPGEKPDSSTYNKRFMEAIQLLELEGFSWGMIYVVTKRSLSKPLKLFYYLTNLCPTGSIMFNPVLLYGGKPKGLAITPEEFVDFLGEIFPIWWKHHDRYPNITPFNMFKQNIIDDRIVLGCSDSGECADSHINLAPDGSTSQCGRSADWGLLDYGSLFDRSISDILNDAQRDLLRDRNTVLENTDCKDCRFWKICHGGCPLDSWADTGSFMHKSPWCWTKKGFIEKYFEPITGVYFRSHDHMASSNKEEVDASSFRKSIQIQTIDKLRESSEPIWINPIGGLGDTLMISGVLKQVVDLNPTKKFNLIKRTKYPPILTGHPAIQEIGHPPPNIQTISTAYWNHEEFGSKNQRAYQILAQIFGLKTPVDEVLYVPWAFEDNPLIIKNIPWSKFNILICPSSDSPRKEMNYELWEALLKRFKLDRFSFIQPGILRNRYIRGSYNLLGVTTPRQAISLVRHFNLVITLDNLFMHAAKLCGVPAIVLWGPTNHHIYGYSEHIHIQANPTCEYSDGCIGIGKGTIYASQCPFYPNHCMNQINIEAIYNYIHNIFLEKFS